jgi:hypothetical protein
MGIMAIEQVFPHSGTGDALVSIDNRLMMYVAGLLPLLQDEILWSRDTYEDAFKTVSYVRARWGDDMLELLRVSGAQYRLLSHILGGKVWNGPIDPLKPTLDIPDLPDNTISVLSTDEQLSAINAKLQTIADSAAAENNEEVLSTLQGILTALGALA